MIGSMKPLLPNLISSLFSLLGGARKGTVAGCLKYQEQLLFLLPLFPTFSYPDNDHIQRMIYCK